MYKIRQKLNLFSSIIALVSLLILKAGCEGQKVSNVEQLKANIRRVLDETWNKGNLEVLDELYATNIVRHFPPFPDLKGIEAYRERIKGIRDRSKRCRLTQYIICRALFIKRVMGSA